MNYTAAHELFEYAAEDELPAAYNGLGVLYYSGWGVPQNFTKAREYFEMGAEYQDADSLVGIRQAFISVVVSLWGFSYYGGVLCE
jgi:TPR repeat protein